MGPDGTITNLEIDPNDPTKKMKEMIQEKDKIPVRQQALFYNKEKLSDNKPAKYYNIKKNDIIDLRHTFPIFVEKPDKTRVKLDVSPEDNILSIRKKIEDKTMPSIPINAQILTYKNSVIDPKDDNKPIKSFGMKENDVIYLSV